MIDWDFMAQQIWHEYKAKEFLKKLDSKPQKSRKIKKKPKGDKNENTT